MKYFIYCRKSSESEDRQILSIQSQLSELKKKFSEQAGVEIIDIYQEAYSAKAPGRTIFNDMLSRIEQEDADGIIAWAPDRLARNSIDGGRIVYLLDQGLLRDLKFATYTFENNSQGKFMLQIMFGQSKYYSDALSENVKRGNRTKIEKGWRPNTAPLGYLNDSGTKTIIKDPVHFPLIRRMFEMVLTGAYTPKQIALIARDEWGFRTPKKKRIGGCPLAMSSIYKILGNPFYAGLILWNGESYPGRHEPIVTIQEFERVRSLLASPGRPRPQRHSFAYTGMIRCGSCGLWVTAEHKVNRQGHRYLYYHCSKRRLGPRCSEPSIEVQSLEFQVQEFLRSLTVDPALEKWILEQIAICAQQFADDEDAREQSLMSAQADTEAQMKELTGMRLRGLLSDQEFVAEREALRSEQLRLREKIAEIGRVKNRFEPARELISFSNRAADWFAHGDDESKRLILQTVGSNLALKDKKLSIEAAKPFASLASLANSPRQLAVVDVVRTFADDEDFQHIIDNIRLLTNRFETSTLASLPKAA
jgi:DNA invertase Pin-like site-specific DNA recombinase